MSQPCRVVHIFLKANNIKFQPCVIALRKGDHFTEEFAKINPVKKVPVIDHNGFILTESVAILCYLSQEFQTPDHWYPKDRYLQAKVNEFMSWQQLNIRLHGSMIFRSRVIAPILTGKPPDNKKIEFHMSEMDKVLDTMSEMFLKDKTFLCGNEISFADIIACCELEQPGAAGYNIFGKHTSIVNYMGRVKDALQPHYDEAHAICKKMKDAVEKGKL